MVDNSDPQALARLAIWARLFCAPIPRRRRWSGFDSKWSGFDSTEWSRLLELAAAVDRKALLRLLGIVFALMFCACLVMAALLMATIFLFSPPLPPSSSLAGWSIMLGVGIGATIAMLAAYWVAIDAVSRYDLTDVLTPRAGDAELIAKVRRQNFFIMGASAVSVLLIIVTMLTFEEPLRPFFDRWGWVLNLFAAAAFLDCVIRTLRRPRRVEPSDPTEHPGGS